MIYSRAWGQECVSLSSLDKIYWFPDQAGTSNGWRSELDRCATRATCATSPWDIEGDEPCFFFLEVVKSHLICFSLEASRPGKLAKLGVVSCPVFEWHEWHEWGNLWSNGRKSRTIMTISFMNSCWFILFIPFHIYDHYERCNAVPRCWFLQVGATRSLYDGDWDFPLSF